MTYHYSRYFDIAIHQCSIKKPTLKANAYVITELTFMINAAYAQLQRMVELKAYSEEELEDHFFLCDTFLNIDMRMNIDPNDFDRMLRSMRFMLTSFNLPSDKQMFRGNDSIYKTPIADEIHRRMCLVMYFLKSTYQDTEQAIQFLKVNWNRKDDSEKILCAKAGMYWDWCPSSIQANFPPNDHIADYRPPPMRKLPTTTYDHPIDLVASKQAFVFPKLGFESILKAADQVEDNEDDDKKPPAAAGIFNIKTAIIGEIGQGLKPRVQNYHDSEIHDIIHKPLFKATFETTGLKPTPCNNEPFVCDDCVNELKRQYNPTNEDEPSSPEPVYDSSDDEEEQDDVIYEETRLIDMTIEDNDGDHEAIELAQEDITQDMASTENHCPKFEYDV